MLPLSVRLMELSELAPMDLRGYDIPTDINELLREHRSRRVMWYQPFIFTDRTVVGTGAAWNNTLGVRQYICTDDDDEQTQQLFLEQNTILGNWYQELVDLVVDASPNSREFLDLGCNAGHFCFSLGQYGKRATGVDFWKECYEIVSRIVGSEFEYIEGRYDSASHRISDLEDRTFDFAIASAIQTHLSDPHFFIAYVAKKCPQGALFTTPVVPYEEPVFRHRITVGRRNRPLPERFEFLPSESAMEVMLQTVYPHVYQRASRVTDPFNTRAWGIWIALRDEVTPAVAEKYGLTKTPDRITQLTDDHADACSLPPLRLGRMKPELPY